MESIGKDCPNGIFVSSKARGSRIKLDFNVQVVRKYNYACRLARLALAMTGSNRKRHQVVEDFMLANDTSTVAVEVPVYLFSDEMMGELGIFRGLDVGDGITGHIDLVQVRYGNIHLLDFKPEAGREKKAASQLLVYAVALSKRTGISLENFVCGWFDEKDYFEFRPGDVI